MISSIPNFSQNWNNNTMKSWIISPLYYIINRTLTNTVFIINIQ